MLVSTMRNQVDNMQLKGLQWLCKYLVNHGECKVMFEIGSYAGESMEVFARHFDAVFCVDTWNEPYDSEDHNRYGWAAVEASFDERARNMLNVHKYKCDSLTVAHNIGDHSLNFVYIDADHEYPAVLADLIAWYPKVKPGAFIGGHDFSYFHPGVPKAVIEFFPLETSTGKKGVFPPRAIMLFPDSSWLVKKEK